MVILFGGVGFKYFLTNFQVSIYFRKIYKGVYTLNPMEVLKEILKEEPGKEVRLEILSSNGSENQGED